MSDDEDVPPLEDMSELVHQIETLRQQPSKSPHVTHVAAVQEQHEDKTMRSCCENGAKYVITKETSESSLRPKTDKPQTFGGMKKGFLFGGSNIGKSRLQSESSSVRQTTSASPDDDIPLIKPKDPDAKQKQYQIDEVQEAMTAGRNFLQNKDWVTEDLLHKVENNGTLLHGLSNPHFMQALNEFQSNPQQALEKYGDNPEVQRFLKEFCALLGDHFTKMPSNTSSQSDGVASGNGITSESHSEQAEISVHRTTKPQQKPADPEEQRVQQILEDPEIRTILLDPDVKSLIDMLRTNPDNAQRLLYQSDSSLQIKIRRLVDVGLLQFQK
ncbi:hypothetical protein LSH36_100g12082 [Paralvinella palmiformis]|uniref:STI1 domain-containing protein n=1 Tax=Paralvinella palmiformis TaxID=53620 RepID=A0AAD9NCP1_9ANNE|nr:hypothetical protein LSH36_100g12082 [Paralvinella palmiformis]